MPRAARPASAHLVGAEQDGGNAGGIAERQGGFAIGDRGAAERDVRNGDDRPRGSDGRLDDRLELLRDVEGEFADAVAGGFAAEAADEIGAADANQRVLLAGELEQREVAEPGAQLVHRQVVAPRHRPAVALLEPIGDERFELRRQRPGLRAETVDFLLRPPWAHGEDRRFGGAGRPGSAPHEK